MRIVGVVSAHTHIYDSLSRSWNLFIAVSLWIINYSPQHLPHRIQFVLVDQMAHP